MRFLFLSEAGDGIGFALRVKDEGNKVWMWTKNKRFGRPSGLIDHIATPEAGLKERPDCVIVDSVGMGALADSLRKRGFKVFGGGLINDKLENDRDFAMGIIKEVGMKFPPYETFSSIGKAKNLVSKTKKRYVFKPNGKEWSNLTYVGKDADDMIGFLEYVERSHAIKGDFLLQEFVEGIECSTNLHFHDGLPILPADQTMELKKFMTGDLGPATGCSASVLWANKSDSPKTIKQTFEKLYAFLRKERFTGPIDVNTIINDEGAWFLELTPRFGYNAHYCWAEMLGGDLGATLHGLATGSLRRLEYEHEMAFGLRVTCPPYPLDPYPESNWKAYDESAGHVVSDFPEKHTWLLDVKSKDGDILTAGSDGLICEITYAGSNLEKLAKQAYDAAKAMKLPDKQYRTDGIERVLKQWPKLKSMGYEVPA